jgi:hypothetical protein
MARGILGTYCWFRGAVGSQFLEVLQRSGYSPPENGFYGDGDGDGPDLSPEYCTELAAWLADHAEAFSAQLFLELRADMNEHEARSTVKQGMETYAYAVWWLRWAASEGGADAWW